MRPGGNGGGAGAGAGAGSGGVPGGETDKAAEGAAATNPTVLPPAAPAASFRTGQGRGVTNGNNTPSRVSQSRVTGRPAASPTAVFNGIRRVGGGQRGGGGRVKGTNGQARDSRAAEAEAEGKTLKELVMFDQILSQVSCLRHWV